MRIYHEACIYICQHVYIFYAQPRFIPRRLVGSHPSAAVEPDEKRGSLRLLSPGSFENQPAQNFPSPGLVKKSRPRRSPARRPMDALSLKKNRRQFGPDFVTDPGLSWAGSTNSKRRSTVKTGELLKDFRPRNLYPPYSSCLHPLKFEIPSAPRCLRGQNSSFLLLN
jgi:hypothetical protein